MEHLFIYSDKITSAHKLNQQKPQDWIAPSYEKLLSDSIFNIRSSFIAALLLQSLYTRKAAVPFYNLKGPPMNVSTSV
jgi:hypothetical protein